MTSCWSWSSRAFADLPAIVSPFPGAGRRRCVDAKLSSETPAFFVVAQGQLRRCRERVELRRLFLPKPDRSLHSFAVAPRLRDRLPPALLVRVHFFAHETFLSR